MKKLLIILLCLPIIGFSQENLYKNIPSSFSLEKYTPTAINQSTAPMCQSFAMSSLHTILYAQQNNITDINKINRNRFSPTFLNYLFHTSDTSCFKDEHNEHASPELEFLVKYVDLCGIPFSSDVEEGKYFPFSDTLIFQYYPNNMDDLINDIKKGSHYTLSAKDTCTKTGVMYISDYGTAEFDFSVDHYKIKKELSSGRPCLMWCFMPYYGSSKARKQNAYDGTTYFDAQNRDDFESTLGRIMKKAKQQMHAMVIIGYDDDKFGGSYRILNSWGENWGDNGKLWMRYVDIADFLQSYKYIPYDKQRIVGENRITEVLTAGKIISFDSDYHLSSGSPELIKKLLFATDKASQSKNNRKILLFKDNHSKIELLNNL